MRYEIGDKVRIKTWEEMEKEYGIYSSEKISLPGDLYYIKEREIELNRLFPDRIIEIVRKDYSHYKVKGEWYYGWSWDDYMIKEKVIDSKESEPEKINNRFDLLDIRED